MLLVPTRIGRARSTALACLPWRRSRRARRCGALQGSTWSSAGHRPDATRARAEFFSHYGYLDPTCNGSSCASTTRASSITPIRQRRGRLCAGPYGLDIALRDMRQARTDDDYADLRRLREAVLASLAPRSGERVAEAAGEGVEQVALSGSRFGSHPLPSGEGSRRERSAAPTPPSLEMREHAYFASSSISS